VVLWRAYTLLCFFESDHAFGVEINVLGKSDVSYIFEVQQSSSTSGAFYLLLNADQKRHFLLGFVIENDWVFKKSELHAINFSNIRDYLDQ
jgi:hypothetical protein